jgi:hypothetical protein
MMLNHSLISSEAKVVHRKVSVLALLSLTVSLITVFSVSESSARTDPPSESSLGQRDVKEVGTATYFWTTVRLKRKSTVIDTIVIENDTSRTGRFKYRFSESVTKSWIVLGEVEVVGGASVKIKKLLICSLQTRWRVELEKSQRSRPTASIAGTFRLGPGEKVFCFRTYGYVKAVIRETKVSGSSIESRRFKARYPSIL